MNWDAIKTSILNTGIKVVVALIILIVAFNIINVIFKKIKEKSDKSGKIDPMLTKALINAGRWLAKILVVIALVGYLGIDTTGFSALIASLGVALGLAVNGTLSNFAGGVLLLITRPFKIGDYIEVAGFEGTVEELKVVSTKLITLDNKVVYVPNGIASTSAITNYTALDLRRVDLTFACAKSEAPANIQNIMQEVMAKHDKVLKAPEADAPFARLSGGTNEAMEFTVRAWCRNADYWDVYFDLTQQITEALGAAGVQAPAVRIVK